VSASCDCITPVKEPALRHCQTAQGVCLIHSMVHFMHPTLLAVMQRDYEDLVVVGVGDYFFLV
jgi:hypothetical protein